MCNFVIFTFIFIIQILVGRGNVIIRELPVAFIMLCKRTRACHANSSPPPAQGRARAYGQLTMDVSFSLHKYSFVVILRFHCYCKINIKRLQLNLLCLLQFCLVLQCAGLLIELVSNPNCKLYHLCDNNELH